MKGMSFPPQRFAAFMLFSYYFYIPVTHSFQKLTCLTLL